MSTIHLTRSEKRRERVVRKRGVDEGSTKRRRKTYRIKAHTLKGRLHFAKIKTKQQIKTVKRIATLRG